MNETYFLIKTNEINYYSIKIFNLNSNLLDLLTLLIIKTFEMESNA